MALCPVFVVSCVWIVVPPLPQLINRRSSLLPEINVRSELTTAAWPPSIWSRSGYSTGALVLCPPLERLSSFGHLFPTHSLSSPPRPTAPSADYWAENWRIVIHVTAAAHCGALVCAWEQKKGVRDFCSHDKTPVRGANPAWINALLLVAIFNRLLQ